MPPYFSSTNPVEIMFQAPPADRKSFSVNGPTAALTVYYARFRRASFSRQNPDFDRSAKRKMSRSILLPEQTAITVSPSVSPWKRAAASATAPLGFDNDLQPAEAAIAFNASSSVTTSPAPQSFDIIRKGDVSGLRRDDRIAGEPTGSRFFRSFQKPASA